MNAALITRLRALHRQLTDFFNLTGNYKHDLDAITEAIAVLERTS